MFSLLFTFVISYSHQDINKRQGVKYMRFLPEIELPSIPSIEPNYSEIIEDVEYYHPPNSRPAADRSTIILSTSYFSKTTEKIKLKLYSKPAGAVILFNGIRVGGPEKLPLNTCYVEEINEDTIEIEDLNVYANKYHHIAIIHNAGCATQNRTVNLKAIINGSEYDLLSPSSLYTFSYSECREGFYGSNCEHQCTEDQCSYNGRCIDGIKGNGKCRCISGFLGENCNQTCKAEIHCNGNGRCMGDGSCLCFEGYSGDTCSIKVDISQGTKAFVGIIFYSVCALAFITAAIIHGMRIKESKPVTHMLLLSFSIIKLVSSILTRFIHNSAGNMSADVLTLLSYCLLVFIVQRNIQLVQHQFRATSPHFSPKAVRWSVFITPTILAILAFAYIGAKQYSFYVICIPYAVCSLWTFIFAILSMYVSMKAEFQKMADVFPVVSSELKRARKLVISSSILVLLEAFLVWYTVDPPHMLDSAVEFAYYGLLLTDIFVVSMIGMANDTILSELYGIKDDGDAYSTAFISPHDDDFSQNSTAVLFVPRYSSAPSAYRAIEDKSNSKKCMKTFFKIVGFFLALVVVGIAAGIVYAAPSKPVWTLEMVSFSGSFDEGTLTMAPSITVYNPMRLWVNLSRTSVELRFRNFTIGKASAVGGRLQGGERMTLRPNITVNMDEVVKHAGGLLSDVLGPDGVMEVNAVAEARPLTMNMVNGHSVVSCPHSLKVLPELQIIGGCGQCEYTVSEFSIDL